MKRHEVAAWAVVAGLGLKFILHFGGPMMAPWGWVGTVLLFLVWGIAGSMTALAVVLLRLWHATRPHNIARAVARQRFERQIQKHRQHLGRGLIVYIERQAERGPFNPTNDRAVDAASYAAERMRLATGLRNHIERKHAEIVDALSPDELTIMINMAAAQLAEYRLAAEGGGDAKTSE